MQIGGQSSLAGPVINYNDLYFRIIISVTAAHIIVTIGEDYSFFQLLVKWDYYRSLLFSAVIAFILVNLVYWVIRHLDRKYDWKLYPLPRLGLQFVLALFLPAIAAFILAFLYFRAFGYDIRHTWYLRYDYPVIVALIFMLNIYYLAFYFFRKWQIAEEMATNASPAVVSVPKEKNVLIVSKGAQNIPLPVSSVAYIFHDGGYNFIRTFEQGEFFIAETLDVVQQQLSEKQFFRVNRQMLVNFTACQHFELLEYGKLELIVKPPFKEPVIISQKRAKAFKDWMER